MSEFSLTSSAEPFNTSRMSNLAGSPAILLVRLIVGFLQGVALYWLYDTAFTRMLFGTDDIVHLPLLAIAIFIPTIIMVSVGHLRLGILLPWTLIAALLCAGLAADYAYNIAPVATSVWQGAARIGAVLSPLSIVLFIGQSLIASASADGKPIASYPRYFDETWKLGLQLVLAAIFAAIFWAILFLGAELFRLIKIEYLRDLIRQSWFYYPTTTIVLSFAIHITDVNAGIVRGTRLLVLTLLSWLLPLLTVLSIAFLLALPFTGLDPLWQTRRATRILFAAVALLILFVNSAHQDGQLDRTKSAVLRYSSVAAVIVLIPLIALAGYALGLRAQQYGWTPSRIVGAAYLTIATIYAAGYVIAATRTGTAMTGLQTTNILNAFVILAVVLALHTPLASPQRLAVVDQVSRLKSGQVSPTDFDYVFLRFRSGRYGNEALKELAAGIGGPRSDAVAAEAKAALDAKNLWTLMQKKRSLVRGPNNPPATAQTRKENITVVYPTSQPIPQRFLETDWNLGAALLQNCQGSADACPSARTIPHGQLPRCLWTIDKCDAILADLDGDGKSEVVLLPRTGTARAFEEAADGRWLTIGYLTKTNTFCKIVRDGLHAGKLTIAEPRYKEIEVAGQRLQITESCPPTSWTGIKLAPVK